MTTTPEQRAAWLELASKATAGPWAESGRDVDHDKMVAAGRNPGDACGLGCEIEGPPEAWLRGQFALHADAAFIAAARTALPELIAEVGRLVTALADCGLAAHNGGIAMDQKARGGREKLAYIERRAAAALAPVAP